MVDLKVSWLSEENAKVERFRMDAPKGYLIGNVGYGRSLADMFGPVGNEHDAARRDFLISLQKPSAWLDELKVEKEARGKGIGTAILKGTIEFLDESGIHYIVLSPRPETPDEGKRLDKFYKRLGFQTIEKHGLWWNLLLLDLDNPKVRRKLGLL